MTDNQGRGEQRPTDPAANPGTNVREMTERLRGAIRTAKQSGITGEQTRGLVDEIFGKEAARDSRDPGESRR